VRRKERYNYGFQKGEDMKVIFDLIIPIITIALQIAIIVVMIKRRRDERH